jgi:hypothetical protein
MLRKDARTLIPQFKVRTFRATDISRSASYGFSWKSYQLGDGSGCWSRSILSARFSELEALRWEEQFRLDAGWI